MDVKRPFRKPFKHDIGRVPRAGLMSTRLHRYWWGFRRPGTLAREHGFFHSNAHNTQHLA